MAHALQLRNLSPDASENDIYNFFCDFQISSIRIHFAAGKDNEANVAFTHKDELLKALKLSNQPLCGKPVTLLLCKSENGEENGKQTFDQGGNGTKCPQTVIKSDDVYDGSDCKRGRVDDDGNLKHLHGQGVDTTFVGRSMFDKTSESKSGHEGRQFLGTAQWDTPAAARSYWERYQQPGPPKMWPWYCVAPGSNSLKSANPPGPVSADPLSQQAEASPVQVEDVREPTTPVESRRRPRKKKALAGKKNQLCYVRVANVGKYKHATKLWCDLEEVLGERPLQIRLGIKELVSNFAYAIYERRFPIPRVAGGLKLRPTTLKKMIQRLQRLNSKWHFLVAYDMEKEYRTNAKNLLATRTRKILELRKTVALIKPVPILKLVPSHDASSIDQAVKPPEFHIRISNIKNRHAMVLWRRLHALGANPVVVRLVQDPQAADMFAYAACYEQFSIPEVMKDSTLCVVPSSEEQMLEELEYLDPHVTITEARRYVKEHEVTRQLEKKFPSCLEKDDTNPTQPSHDMNTQDIDPTQPLPKISNMEDVDPTQNVHSIQETSKHDIIPIQPQSKNMQEMSPTITADITASVSEQDVSSIHLADIVPDINTQDTNPTDPTDVVPGINKQNVNSTQTSDIKPDVSKQEVSLSQTTEIPCGVSTQHANPTPTADIKADIDKQTVKQIQGPHIVSNVNKQDINPTETAGTMPVGSKEDTMPIPGPTAKSEGRNQNTLPPHTARKTKKKRQRARKKPKGKQNAHDKKHKMNTAHPRHTTPGITQHYVNPTQPPHIAPGIKRPNMNPPHAAPSAKRQKVNPTQPARKKDWRKNPKTKQPKIDRRKRGKGKNQQRKQQVNTMKPQHNNMPPVKGQKTKQNRPGRKGKNGPPMGKAQQACLNLVHTKQNKPRDRRSKWAKGKKHNAPS